MKIRTSLGAAVAVVTLSASAAANGRFPTAQQIALSPTDPDLVLARTTFGVLESRDHGKTWDWMCESAAGYADEDPAIALTATNSMILALESGLVVSTNLGCGWQTFGSTPMIDLVVRPDAPHTTLAINESYVGSPDAGVFQFDNVVWISPNDGASWGALGAPLDSFVRMDTIEVAGASRIYVSARRTQGQTVSGVMFVSDDSGAHWTERAIPLVAQEGSAYIAAVDPASIDRVYVRTLGKTGTGPSRLLVSNDGAVSFQEAFTLPNPILGFALSADGATIFLGNLDGVYKGTRGSTQFAKVSALGPTSLVARAGELWATVPNGVALSTDDGASFATKLTFPQIRAPITCPARTAGASCIVEWDSLRAQLGIPATVDGGPPDDASSSFDGAATSDAGVAPPDEQYIDRPVGGCGCGATGTSRATAAGGIAAIAVAALVRRRRRVTK